MIDRGKPTDLATAGFTLVEMVVALTLLGLLTVFLTAAVRQVNWRLRSWEIETPAELDQATVRDFLRRLLDQAYPAIVLRTKTPVVTFDGNPDSLVLTTAMPPWALPGGFYRVGLSVRDGRLLLRWEPERNRANGALEHAPVRELLTDVAGLRFQYFDPVGTGDHPVWVPEWHARGHLPALVRVDLEFHQRAGAPWLPLVVQPHVEEDVGCIYGPLTFTCRGR